MPCSPDILRDVPLFSLLDEEELAGHAETQGLARRINQLYDKVENIEEALRGRGR